MANLETDLLTEHMSASGWIVRTMDTSFRSDKTTIQLAFEDFLAGCNLDAPGVVTAFIPVGYQETDFTTVFDLTERLLRRAGKLVDDTGL